MTGLAEFEALTRHIASYDTPDLLAELVFIVREVAEIPTTFETPGIAAHDDEMDSLIIGARATLARWRLMTADRDGGV